MPFVLGIDEAGYGPTLGPLTVGATLWRVDSRKTAGDFWDYLSDAVCKATGGASWQIVVDDSKAAYERKEGIGTLERSVLAFANAARLPVNSLRNILGALGADDLHAAPIPWYRDLDHALPLDPARSKFSAVAERLSDTMREAGVVCHGLRCEVVTEDRFNQRVAGTRNKASVVVEQVLRHIDWAGQAANRSDLHVFVDRLGGRADYRRLLADAFPQRHTHVVEVGATRSAYRLAAEENDWHIEFGVESDQRHLCVALASMVAKYVREALMQRFNAFWAEKAPAVKPTAGYYVDAQRFLKDIAPVLPHAGVAQSLFVRAR